MTKGGRIMNKKVLIVSILIMVVILGIFFLGRLLTLITSTPTLSRLDDTGVTQEGVKSIVNANNQFAFELYSELNKESKGDNIFFSPYSISVGLAMTYEGARGETAKEMRQVLRIPEDENIRRANFARIINEINKPDKRYKLLTANALWTRRGFQLLGEYQSTIKKYYGGKAAPLNYGGDPKGARQIINNWVKDKTENKIKDLISANDIDPDNTVLILTNAIYFKGSWVLQFDSKETQEGDFRTSSGKIVKVPMMRLLGEEFNYAESEDFQILEMLYDGKDLSMLIILPKENKLEKVEEELSNEKLSEWKGMLKKQTVDIYIPRFKFKTKYHLENNLKKMGMLTAFSRDADFSGINGEGGIWIDKVIHQAFVDVNEEGTEATAEEAWYVGTGVGFSRIVPVFRADHPFIFLIQDRRRGNILFIGKVANPSH